MAKHSSPAVDERVFLTLHRADFGLSLQELADQSQVPLADLKVVLDRLVAAGRVKMTADRAARAYYTRSQQLL